MAKIGDDSYAAQYGASAYGAGDDAYAAQYAYGSTSAELPYGAEQFGYGANAYGYGANASGEQEYGAELLYGHS